MNSHHVTMKNISARIETQGYNFLFTYRLFVVRFFRGWFICFWLTFKGSLVSDSREEVGSRSTWAFWVRDEFSWEDKLHGFSEINSGVSIRISRVSISTCLWTWPWIRIRASPSHWRILPTSLLHKRRGVQLRFCREANVDRRVRSGTRFSQWVPLCSMKGIPESSGVGVASGQILPSMYRVFHL